MYSFAIENRIAANENSHRSPNQTERLLSTATGSIMLEAVVLPLDTWQNFYVIVGTAAATLTGLMFVVITPGSRVFRTRPSWCDAGAIA